MPPYKSPYEKKFDMKTGNLFRDYIDGQILAEVVRMASIGKEETYIVADQEDTGD